MKPQPPDNLSLCRGALTAMVALGVIACAATPQPGMEHGHLIQPKISEGPFCERHPVESLPPEVARVRRVLVKRFTGKFTRDGVFAWTAIDLERLVAVSIERRVFDPRAHHSLVFSNDTATPEIHPLSLRDALLL